MNVTAKLVRLHLVEKNIRGLTERLKQAETYLGAQNGLVQQLDAQRESLRGQLRQVEAALKNDENEAAAFDQRIERLREQMNAAKSNKEYSAFLAEINTLKADKKAVDERQLVSMQKVEDLRKQVAAVEEQRAEREKVRGVAEAERDQRMGEIKGRLEELTRERAAAAEEVPERALKIFDTRVAEGHEDIMAPLEEHDRRNREYCCGSCQVLLPLEKLNGLLGRGELTLCTNCGVLLYLEESVRENVSSTRR